MKSLTVQLPDKLYDRAERHAAERGATLHETVVEFVTRCYGAEDDASATCDPASRALDVSGLLNALDRGHNRTPLGRLNRDELYDREVLR